MAETDDEFRRGWAAALLAAQHWHQDQASKALVQAKRSRFPKNFEREAAMHQQAAESIPHLSPEDL